MSSPVVSTLAFLAGLDVVVEHPRHRRAQPGDVRAAVLLRNVVGEGEQVLGVGVVPLHRHLDPDRRAGHGRFGGDVEDVRVQDRLGLVDVLDEAPDAAGEGKVLFLAGALVVEPDAHAVVEERELAQPLGQDLVVELDDAEDRLVGQEMHFGAALVGLADDLHRRDLDPVDHLDDAVLDIALAELEEVHLAVAADRQAQPFRQRVDAGHADSVQPAGDLVAVLIELAAGVQFGQRDLGGRALRLVLVVHLDAGRDTAAVVDHRQRVVGMDGDDDVVAVAGERLVDRVVDDLEDHVVQASAVLRVADVHARPLAHGLEPLEDLDRAGAVFAGRVAAARLRRCIGYC